jgi:hypothetical protein
MADIKSMTLEQAKAYKAELKSQGLSESTSKEYGKLVDYIATLQPDKFGDERLGEAYSKLSRGVTTTGGWTEQNLDLIEQYTGTRPQLQDPTQDINAYLSGYQDMVYGAASSVELRESIAAQLEPETARPEPFSRVEQFETMREEYGVADLEATLTDLKASVRDEYAIQRQRTAAAEGAAVPLGVIAGRVTEIERQQAERIDAYNREIAYITDQLNSAYNVIDKYINYMGLDYQDAVTAYNEEFNRNLKIYELTTEELSRQQATARANLQLYVNAITSGNLTWDGLSSDEKLQISRMEISSGLPMGFISSLHMNAKDRLLFSNSDTGQAVLLNPDGTTTTINTGMSRVTSGTASTDKSFQSAVEQGRKDLSTPYWDWGQVFERISNQFPDVSDATINAALGGSAYYDPETGKFDESKATGYAVTGAYEATQTTSTSDADAALREAISTYQRATTKEQKTAVRNAFAVDYPEKIKDFDDAIGF